jgi:hypothetical protein
MTPSTVAPFGEAHLLEGALAAQRRVVDEIVDAAELLRRVRHHREHRLLVATSATTAIALPPSRSISRTTCSASACSSAH